jgi:hypothetical protein
MKMEGSRTIYVVPMGEQIGYVGAALGNPAAYHLRLIIEGTNEVITAFPYIPPAP